MRRQLAFSILFGFVGFAALTSTAGGDSIRLVRNRPSAIVRADLNGRRPGEPLNDSNSVEVTVAYELDSAPAATYVLFTDFPGSGNPVHDPAYTPIPVTRGKGTVSGRFTVMCGGADERPETNIVRFRAALYTAPAPGRSLAERTQNVAGYRFRCPLVVKEAKPPQVVLPPQALAPQITGYETKTSCVGKKSSFFILGTGFGTQMGKGAALGGHGIHVDLTIHSWTPTRIGVSLPADPRIEAGQWYYVGIEKADHTAWLSNINKNLTICGSLK